MDAIEGFTPPLRAGRTQLRVAIVHYWLVNYRGGEKVIEAICEIFPQAHIFTHVHKPKRIPSSINSHPIKTSFISKLPFAGRLYQVYLPLMPLALEQLDLRQYDLVISSESGPAKGVLTAPGTLHVCYCHTPMRYAWSMYWDYTRHAGRVKAAIVSWLIHRLRMWDFQSASRVDYFIANSRNIARQIGKYYRRSSFVVQPPVDVEQFSVAKYIADYYLCVGQLVRYKRFDLAIEAFNALAKPLLIIGDGEEYKRLKRIAGPTITFLGHQDTKTLQHHYATCRALVFPGNEDFGIVPLEAMASGRPVIAFGRGGALETVIPDETGVLFYEQTPAMLAAAVREFESKIHRFIPSSLVDHARQFSRANFKRRFAAALLEAAHAAGIELSLPEAAATWSGHIEPPAVLNPTTVVASQA